jgi:hypothetical protein
MLLYVAILSSFLAIIFPNTEEAGILRTIHCVITSITCLTITTYMVIMLDHIETKQRQNINRVYYDNTSDSDDRSWSDVFSSSDD